MNSNEVVVKEGTLASAKWAELTQSEQAWVERIGRPDPANLEVKPEVVVKEETLEGTFNSNGPGFQVSGIVGVVREYSTPIHTDFFEPDSHGYVPTVLLSPDKVKQLGVKQGDAVYLIFDTEFETATVSKEDSKPVIEIVANQFGTMLKTRPKAPSKFNPNGPGALGFNACAKCGTDVDINGLDRDNRNHFEADGGCAGFAKAQLDKVKARFLAAETDSLRALWFSIESNAYVRQALLSTIQNKDVRDRFEKVHETLSAAIPVIRRAEQNIEQAVRELNQSFKN